MKSIFLTAVLSFVMTGFALGQSVAEFPPSLLPSVDRSPLDGGRTQTIAVKPGSDSEIVISTEFGGLWKTSDTGAHWRHLTNLRAISSVDVAYAEGDTLIATVVGTNKVIDDSGIWVSPDGGDSWRPAEFGWHGGAAGISVAPDNRRKIYVAMDFGVATSTDNGNNWTRTNIDGAWPGSILALPHNQAILLAKTGVFRLMPDGTWDNIKPVNFNDSSSNKQVDVWSGDPDKIFVLQDRNRLFLYEMGANRFTAIQMPTIGGGRPPFIRISNRPGGARGFEIWVGNGVTLLRRTCANIAEALSSGPFNWHAFGRDHGIHDDPGFLALNSAGLPHMYGCDGGVFKPTDSSAIFWERAALSGSGLNSYQITALGGTEYDVGALSLYFATQDNGSLWSSPDGGITWPRASSPEGWFVQVAPHAHDPAAVTVAWNSVRSTARWTSMFANGNMEGEREVPANVRGSRTGFLDDFTVPMYISPRTWVRYRTPRDLPPELFISRDNGDHWVQIASVLLASRGFLKPSAAGGEETVYAPFTANPLSNERIGLIRFNLRTNQTYGEANLIYLPDNGTLGMRATMFDHSAVFGVDPLNPDFIIAPDIANDVIKVTRNGGRTWTTDVTLTNLVTRFGQYRLGILNRREIDKGSGNMEVTTIYFDPFNSRRILIGTREVGIIWSGDSGLTWAPVRGSEKILYCTGLFMTHTNEGFAASYGRGLWRLDFRSIRAPFPVADYCAQPRCGLRLRGASAAVQTTLAYGAYMVLMVHNGHINGLKYGKDGEVELITVTPGSNFVQYLGDSEDAPRPVVKESEQGIGFDDEIAAQAALKNKEFVNAIVIEKGRLKAVISAQSEFVRKGFAQLADVKSNDPRTDMIDPTKEPVQAVEELYQGRRPLQSDFTRPILFVTTSLPSMSIPILGFDGVLHLWAAGVKPNSELIGAPMVLTIDDVAVNKDVRFEKDGTLSMKITVPKTLSYGAHYVTLVSGAKPPLGAMFVKGHLDDSDEKPNEGKKPPAPPK